MPAPKRRIDLREVTTLRDAARVFFSRPGPRRLAAHAAGAWIARAFCGPPSLTELPVVGAVVAWWPLQEWLAHRYILHARRADVPVVSAVAARHAAHHDQPDDLDLTLLPLEACRASLPAAFGFWAIAGLGSPRRIATGVATYATMALIYEWIHMLTHTSVRPRTDYFRRVRRRHRLHHALDPDAWLGFTWPRIDDLLGTAPDPRERGRELKRRREAAAAPA